MRIDYARVRLVENVQDQGPIENWDFGKEFNEDCEREAIKKLVEFLMGEGAVKITKFESGGHQMVRYLLEIIMPEEKK